MSTAADQAEALDDVARYAEAIRRNDATANSLRQQRARAMKDARRAGSSLAQIAEVAGISREHVRIQTRPKNAPAS